MFAAQASFDIAGPGDYLEVAAYRRLHLRLLALGIVALGLWVSRELIEKRGG